MFIGKLNEFNSRAGEGSRFSEADLKQVERLVTDGTATAQQLDILWRLMQWPVGELSQSGRIMHRLSTTLISNGSVSLAAIRG